MNLGSEGESRWILGLLLIWLYPPRLGVGRFDIDDRGVGYGGKESEGSSMGWNGLRRRMSGVGGRCRIAAYLMGVVCQRGGKSDFPDRPSLGVKWYCDENEEEENVSIRPSRIHENRVLMLRIRERKRKDGERKDHKEKT